MCNKYRQRQQISSKYRSARLRSISERSASGSVDVMMRLSRYMDCAPLDDSPAAAPTVDVEAAAAAAAAAIAICIGFDVIDISRALIPELDVAT